jgi:hypothetical protein
VIIFGVLDVLEVGGGYVPMIVSCGARKEMYAAEITVSESAMLLRVDPRCSVAPRVLDKWLSLLYFCLTEVQVALTTSCVNGLAARVHSVLSEVCAYSRGTPGMIATERPAAAR